MTTPTLAHALRAFNIGARLTLPARASLPISVRRARPRERHHAGRTSQHRAAFAIFRALVQPLNLRVVPDVEGFPTAKGRGGSLEWFSTTMLAAYSSRPRKLTELLAIPGVLRHQTGDREARVLVAPKLLPEVARLFHLRRRRRGPLQNLGLSPR